MNSLKDSVEKHFSKVINQMEAGLPDVPDDEIVGEDWIEGGDTWTCPTCINVNKNDQLVCTICKTKKVELKKLVK